MNVNLAANVGFIPFFVFRILVKMTKNEKISCTMTADFGNFVAKTDEKRKSKDEMNRTLEIVGEF